MQIIERVQLTFYGNNNKNYGEDVSIVCWLELEAMQTNKISIDWSEIKFTEMWDLNGSPVRPTAD